jgi:hypothetical protein
MTTTTLTIDTDLLQETQIALSTREIELCKALANCKYDALESILSRQLDRTTRALESVNAALGISR